MFSVWLNKLSVVDTLEAINLLLMAFGGAILLRQAWGTLIRRRPLVGTLADVRGFQPGVEFLFVPMFAYLAAFTLLYPLIKGWLGIAEVELAADGGEGSTPIDFAALLTNNSAMLIGALACWEVGRRCVAQAGRPFVRGGVRLSGQVVEGVAGVLVALAACQAMLFVTVWLIRLTNPEFAFNEHGVIDALRDPDRPVWLPFAMWIGVAVVTPIAEELFFRGLLQTALGKILKRRWLAIVLASFVFGLAHGAQPQVIPAIMLFGIILGVLYERRGSLIGPILAHALFNAKTLLWESLSGGAGG